MATLAEAAFEVLMPRLSDSMSEGVIVRWLCADGDLVRAGQEIAEVETDKATLPFEAEAEGSIRILVAEGATVPVGDPIATIHSATAARPSPSAARPSRGAARTSISASPIARRLAAANGIDLSVVPGSGPAGRILKADVKKVVKRGVDSPAAPSARPASPSPTARPSAARRAALTPTQAMIAKRMTEAHTSVPVFFTESRFDAEPILDLRDRLRAEGVEHPPSLNDFVIKAVALTLREHQIVNTSFVDGVWEDPGRIDVGVAVAGERALYVPVIRQADLTPLVEIARRVKEASARARSGGLRPEDMAGATFTVSNLGMYGVTRFQAIVSPPQAAILAVGAALPQILPDGESGHRIARVVSLGLSADHRVVYGADAAAFLADLRDRLTMPTSLLLGASQELSRDER